MYIISYIKYIYIKKPAFKHFQEKNIAYIFHFDGLHLKTQLFSSFFNDPLITSFLQ